MPGPAHQVEPVDNRRDGRPDRHPRHAALLHRRPLMRIETACCWLVPVGSGRRRGTLRGLLPRLAVVGDRGIEEDVVECVRDLLPWPSGTAHRNGEGHTRCGPADLSGGDAGLPARRRRRRRPAGGRPATGVTGPRSRPDQRCPGYGTGAVTDCHASVARVWSPDVFRLDSLAHPGRPRSIRQRPEPRG